MAYTFGETGYDPSDAGNVGFNSQNLASAGDPSIPGRYSLDGMQYTNGGSEGDINTYQSYVPDNQDWLNSFGYGGPGQVNVGGEGGAPQVNPDLQRYLKQKGFTLGQMYDPGNGTYGAHTYRAFDQNGKGQGGGFTMQDHNEDAFFTAMTILSMAAGGGIGAAEAGGMGAGAMGTSIAQGAGAGAAGASWQSGGDPKATIIGGLSGAAGGAVGGYNPAGSVGITDPDYSRWFNNAAGSGVKAGLQGGNVGQAVLSSGLNSGLSAGLQQGASMFGDNNPDYSNEGNNYKYDNASFQQSGNPLQQSLGDQNQMSLPSNEFSKYLSSGPGTNTEMPNTDVSSQAPGSPNFQQDQGNGVKDYMKKALGLVQGPSTNGSPGNFDNMAGNLMQLFQSYKNQKRSGGMADNLNSLYSPNSPYAQQLQQTLLRHDAASGRRSQVGPRSVELQARLADLNSRNAPMLAQLYGNQQNNQGQMLQSLLRMGMGGQNGGDMFRKIGGGLSSMFPSSGGNLQGYNPASDYNYQNGMDLGN